MATSPKFRVRFSQHSTSKEKEFKYIYIQIYRFGTITAKKNQCAKMSAKKITPHVWSGDFPDVWSRLGNLEHHLSLSRLHNP